MKEKLHAKRAATEEHIRELEKEGKAGTRYTITMPDMAFMVLGLICDIGWILQVVFGMMFMNADAWKAVAPPGTAASTAVAADLILTLIGIVYTAHLGKIHEKEIALRHQKNLSFGLTVLGGITGIVIGAAIGSAGFFIGGILNTAGAADFPVISERDPIRSKVSGRKLLKAGIRYGVR